MWQYYLVIGGFVLTMVVTIVYVILDPKESVAKKQIIDENAILVHNGGDYSFTMAPNNLFQVS